MFDIAKRSLYLCVAYRDDMSTFLPAVLGGGVDIVQLREKELPADYQIKMAEVMLPICRDFGVPFIMNDSPELAERTGADGVHVGQDDTSVAACRELLGPDSIIGLSTHSPAEFESSLLQAASYFSAGPIVETPTKRGRPGTGTDYAVACQRSSDRPVFVTGGVTEEVISDLVIAGLRHFVVVRALTESPSPEATARALRRAIDEALSAVTIEPAE